MPLPSHLFASDTDGGLYDTRAPDWSRRPPVRRLYNRSGGQTPTLAAVKAALRAGEHAWPGGYPLYFVTRDGAALSFAAVRAEWRQVVWDFLADASTGWRIEAVAINYEDADLRCDHTGARIPSAYADAEPEEH